MCESEGCDEVAEFYDTEDNKVCRDCMSKMINEEGFSAEDFEQFRLVC